MEKFLKNPNGDVLDLTNDSDGEKAAAGQKVIYFINLRYPFLFPMHKRIRCSLMNSNLPLHYFRWNLSWNLRSSEVRCYS